jgi:hypothetical protein
MAENIGTKEATDIELELEPQTQTANSDNDISDENKSQLELAREAGNTWEFEGKEYELFVANKQGGVSVPIVPETEVVAYASAVFAWDKKDDLLDALDLEIKEVLIEDSRKTDTADITALYAGVFHNTAQSGFWTEIVDGEKQEPQFLSREQMLKADEEIQASLIRNWIDSISISVYKKPGETNIDAFFNKTAKNKYILAKIGDKKNPKHVLLFEFKSPSLEIRRELKQKRNAETKDENGKTVRIYPNTSHFRMKQCANHLVSVQGVSLLEPGKLFDATSESDKKTFLANFNPIWQVYLTDALFASFDTTGK